MSEEIKKRLEEIEKDVQELKLASDDHWHSCDDLRIYCEQKLIEYSDNQLPYLITQLRESLASEASLKEERDEAMMSAGYSNPDNEPLIETIKKLRADLQIAVEGLECADETLEIEEITCVQVKQALSKLRKDGEEAG